MRAPNYLTPVPQFPHLPIPRYRENDCLIMNIVTPPAPTPLQKFPVMVYIHGGAFVYGGANRSVFDGVNLVTYSIELRKPVISIAINYRVGLWGFLASRDIQEDLARDGFTGTGNFGISDQQLALQWLQRYVSSFNGDPDNVTIVGESAGGTSVAMHLLQNTQGQSFYPEFSAAGPGFQRAVQMSGGHTTIPVMPLAEHERQYRILLQRLGIDPNQPGGLERLRSAPEQVVNQCTIPVQGALVSTYNPCDDGVLLGPTSNTETMLSRPTFDNYQSPPSWLKSFMLGDVKDEGVIFRLNQPYTFDMIINGLERYMASDDVQKVISLYGLTSKLEPQQLRDVFEEMASDTIFKAENYVMAHRSKIPQTFAYHFDEPSTVENPLRGTSYHAIDLLYLFRNLRTSMTEQQKALSDQLAGHWIDFAYGKDPWERFGSAHRWMVYGPNGEAHLKTEAEDEGIRRYKRIDTILGLGKGVYQAFADAMDYVAWQRFLTTEKLPN